MLDERKTAILRAVVQEYIATAQPVGSSHIADAPGVEVSSATVRNEMAVLEQEGYLAQPHTSAGRVPTDKGYRFFVDHLTAPGRLDAVAAKQVGEFFDAAHGRLEEMLHQTRTCSPAHQQRRRRRRPACRGRAPSGRCRSSALSRTAATVVVVLSQRRRRERARSSCSTDDRRPQARPRPARTCRRRSTGRALGSAVDIAPTGDAAVDRLCDDGARCAAAAVEPTSTSSSAARSTVASAFDAVETVRQVLRTLEQQFVVVSLVRDILDRGCRWPSAPSTASSRWRRARSWSRPSWSTASRSARSACSARPA